MKKKKTTKKLKHLEYEGNTISETKKYVLIKTRNGVKIKILKR
ncbi:MAG: hypothetical protein K1000chlam2_00846 [Chlamydiae bacterium]|nr:hypothetical protein [Chlamydiota bacterium]